jgi:LacI family transcriptional regulator
MLDLLMQGIQPEQKVVTYGPSTVTTRASTSSVQVSDRLIIQALEFIRVNAGLNIRVSDVATHLGITPRWAEQRFKEATGQSLHENINQTRMHTICSLLNESDLSLRAIATRCGFSQLHHLCSIFKKEFGITMSEYREKGEEVLKCASSKVREF